MTEGRALLEALLNGESLTEEQGQALSDWVCASKLNALLAAELMHLEQAVHGSVSNFALNLDDSSVALALGELMRLENQTEIDPIHLPEPEQLTGCDARPSPPLSAQDLAVVAGYVGVRALRSRAVIWGALAAVLVIGLVLFIRLAGPGKPIEPAIVQAPILSPQLTVARLTAMDQARWQSGVYFQGQALHAGQTLALESGLAEITTAHGATATIQGPCTVQVLEGGNALRLQSGRLVGWVASDKARGFVVRTPHMEVTDLGTRFGVDATDMQATEVHVLEGLVQVQRAAPDGSTRSKQLYEGQATRAQADSPELIDINDDASRFAAIRIDPLAPPAQPTLSKDAMAAGIVNLTGGTAWSSMRPFRFNRTDLPAGEHAFICAELQNYTLASDIRLSFTQTSDVIPLPSGTSTNLPAGSTIRSYFVFLNTGSLNREDRATCRGSVTFDAEILGVITTTEDWHTFAKSIPEEENLIFRHAPGILTTSLEEDDQITLSADRRTLTFQLSGWSLAEVIRVIVKEPSEKPGP